MKSRAIETTFSWIAVLIMTAIIYLTLPYGPLIREKIYKSFQPQILESYLLQHRSFHIKEKNSIFYSAEGVNGIGIYEIIGVDSVQLIQRIAAEIDIQDFIESRKILYAGDGSAGVRIFDIKNPTAPVELSRPGAGAVVHDFDIYENYLYLISGSNRLSIIDISVKEEPAEIRRMEIGDNPRRIRIHGNSAIIGMDDGMICLLHLADPTEPRIIGCFPVPGAVSSIYASENLLYVGSSLKGLTVYDISDIHHPKRTGELTTDFELNDPRYRKGYLLYNGGDKGVVIINVNDPESPKLVRTFDTGNRVTGLYSRYYFAYATDTTPAVHYIDIDTGRFFILYFVGVSIFIALLFLALYMFRTRKSHTVFNYLSLLLIGIIYAWFLNDMKESPIEALHFLEYGILSALLYRALRHHLNDKIIFFIATGLITLIGIGDELIQWMLPNRHWDFRDIGFNTLSGALIQLAIWFGIAPEILKYKIELKSLRCLKNLFLLLSLVFAILLSMTPAFNSRMAERFTFLKFLDNPEPISEYGYKVFHPDIGGFFSRYRESDLLRYDARNGEIVGKILNDNIRTNYSEFLRIYSSGKAPFTHEMRVHLFRRDRYYHDKRYWVAYKENLILENFFTNALHASAYRWRNGEADVCREQIGDRAQDFYVSPVSWNIITSYNVRTVWFCFFIFSVVIIALYYIFRRTLFS
jgi:VanZ family protein